MMEKGRFLGYYYSLSGFLSRHPGGVAGDSFVNGETLSLWIWNPVERKWINSNRPRNWFSGITANKDFEPVVEEGVGTAYLYCTSKEDVDAGSVTFANCRMPSGSAVTVAIEYPSVITLYWNGDYWETGVVAVAMVLPKDLEELKEEIETWVRERYLPLTGGTITGTLKVEGPLIAEDSLQTNVIETTGGTIEVHSGVRVVGDIEADKITAETLQVNSGADIAEGLSVTGGLKASGGINLSGSLSATGNISTDGGLTVKGDATVSGDLTVSGDATLKYVEASDIDTKSLNASGKTYLEDVDISGLATAYSGILVDGGNINVSDGSINASSGNIRGNLTVRGTITGTLDGTAARATADGDGNTITTTYATKGEMGLSYKLDLGKFSAGTYTLPLQNTENRSHTFEVLRSVAQGNAILELVEEDANRTLINDQGVSVSFQDTFFYITFLRTDGRIYRIYLDEDDDDEGGGTLGHNTKQGYLTDSTYLTASGGTITGDLTVEGTITGTLDGTAARATADGDGNTIAETYVTKGEMAETLTYEAWERDTKEYGDL